MSLDNCPICGKLFMKSPGYISCLTCRQEEDECIARFRAFFDEHGSATLREVIDGTGIDEKLIRKFMEGDRLKSSAPAPTITRCQECNRITEGARICPDCLKRKPQVSKNTPSSNSQRSYGISHELRTDQWSNRRD